MATANAAPHFWRYLKKLLYRSYFGITVQSSIMSAVTVSPKYQVVIPKAIRDRLSLSPGDKIEVIQLDGRIELIPVPQVKSLRGILKGVKNNFERDSDRCIT